VVVSIPEKKRKNKKFPPRKKKVFFSSKVWRAIETATAGGGAIK